MKSLRIYLWATLGAIIYLVAKAYDVTNFEGAVIGLLCMIWAAQFEERA